MGAEPTGAHARDYAESVRDHARRRALFAGGLHIAGLGEQPGESVEQAIEEAERRIMAIAEDTVADTSCTAPELVADVFDRIEAQAQGRGRRGIPTGLASLDNLLGGLRAGELVVVAARPGVGKTALCVQIAGCAAIKEELPVRLVSLEQSHSEIGDRLHSLMASVDGSKLRDGSLSADETQRLYQAGSRVRESALVVDDAPCQTVLRIAATARRMKRRQGLALLVVDYLQFVEPDSRREPRHEQVSTISRRLKALARELEVPILAAAQLNREAENGRKPRLSDLRESGGIEADADVVMLLHRDDVSRGINVDVAKHRNGPMGEIALNYIPAFTRFEDPIAGSGF